MNLKYMKVSLFEISYKKKLFHDILIYWDAPVMYVRIILPLLSMSSNIKTKLSSKEMCESSLSSSVKYSDVLASLRNLATPTIPLFLWSDKICLAKRWPLP